MTARTILTALFGLALGMHLRLQDPRRGLADAAEHALGWVCRMTYDSRQSGTKLPTTAERPVRVQKAPLGLKSSRDAACNIAQPDRVNPAAIYFLRMLGLPRLRETPVQLRP